MWALTLLSFKLQNKTTTKQVCVSVGLCEGWGAAGGTPRRLLLAGAPGDAAAAVHALREAAAGAATGAAADGAWGAATAKLRARYGAAAAGAAAALPAATASNDPLAAARARLAAALAGPQADSDSNVAAAGDRSNSNAAGTADSSNSMGCDLCEAAVQYVRAALRSNATVEQIEEVMI